MDRVRKFQRERDVGEARFRVLFVFSLIVIAVVAGLVEAILNANTTMDPITLEVFSLEEVYAGALANAQEWNSDTYLSDARFAFRPASDAEGRWAALQFRSPSDPRERLNVFVTEASEGLEYELSPAQYEDDEPLGDPISPGKLAIDAGEALEISLWNGGNKYIQEVGDSMRWPQNLYLRHRDRVNETDLIVWRASSFSPFFGPGIWVEINAQTGELLESS